MTFFEYLYEEHHALSLILFCSLSLLWCFALINYPAIVIGGTSGVIIYRLIQAYKQYRKEYGFQLKGKS